MDHLPSIIRESPEATHEEALQHANTAVSGLKVPIMMKLPSQIEQDTDNLSVREVAVEDFLDSIVPGTADYGRPRNAPRTLKGSSSKSSKSSRPGGKGKGGSKNGNNRCSTFQVFVKVEEINDNFNDLGFGFTFRVPFYRESAHSEDMELGLWYENILYTDSDDGGSTFKGNQGSGTIVMTFNVRTSLTLAGAFNQAQIAVTGGAGRFRDECISGFAQPVEEKSNRVYFDITTCSGC